MKLYFNRYTVLSYIYTTQLTIGSQSNPIETGRADTIVNTGTIKVEMLASSHIYGEVDRGINRNTFFSWCMVQYFIRKHFNLITSIVHMRNSCLFTNLYVSSTFPKRTYICINRKQMFGWYPCWFHHKCDLMPSSQLLWYRYKLSSINV